MKQKRFLTRMILILTTLLHLPCTLRSTEGDTWVARADMPTARNGLCACTLNGKIYVIGGVNRPGIDTEVLRTVEEYDPTTDSWEQKSDMPTSRNWAACAVVNGKIYVVGGDRTFLASPRRTVEEYDPLSDTWTPKADMPTARSALVAAAVDGKIYAIGGLTTMGAPPLAVVEAYDPVSDTWERKASMPTARGMAGVGVVNGKIFVIGSFLFPTGPASAVVEMYDPQKNVWARKSNMPTARGALACATVLGRIYALGGRSGGTVVATVEEYSPLADKWETRAEMSFPDAQGAAPRWSLAASEVNDRIYAIGGAELTAPPFPTLSMVLEYTPPQLALEVELQIRPLTKEGKSFIRLEWPSDARSLDLLQTRGQISSGAWSDLETSSGAGEPVSKEIPAADTSAFYRLRREPR